MKKNIYIFTSRGYQPNLYINIVGSCVSKFGIEDIEDIYLLKILKEKKQKEKDVGDSKKPTPSEELKRIRRNIFAQINCLSQSQFLLWDKSKNDFESIDTPKSIKIENGYNNLYSDIKNKIYEDEIKYRVIKEKDIEDTLSRIISNPYYQFIFDLTGIDKNNFLQISLVLLSKESSIYFFESIRWFSNDENDMIHNLLFLREQHPERDSFDHYMLNPENYHVIKNVNESYTEKIKKQWKNDISKDKTKKVIPEIIEYIDKEANIDLNFQKEILNLSSRYHELQNNQNILSKKDYDLEKNRINNALIELILKM